MYMFLSDRIRRMFLSGTCPENLFPKKPLSLKDHNFLQKTKAHQSLSRVVIKQQKLLYERHIGTVLQKTSLKFKPSSDCDPVFLKEQTNPPLSSIPVYLPKTCKVQKTLKKKSSVSLMQSPLEFQENKMCDSLFKTLSDNRKVFFKSKATKAEENNRVFKLNPSFFSLNKKTSSDPVFEPSENYNFQNQLTLFVQSFFTQKENVKGHLLSIDNKPDNDPLDYITTVNSKKNKKKYKEKKPQLLEKQRELLEKAALFSETRQKSSSSFNKITTPSALANLQFLGKYTNCRYLYDHESLKTCIVPQIFKNQEPVSRAKMVLHERKKIALLYGQLAKKDILNISQKAYNIPGFFEDNMFTLLESRVDVCIFRAGFSKTIAGARQLIRNGSVLVNGKKMYSSKRRAKPGDYFSFASDEKRLKPYQRTTLELYNFCLSSRFLKQWFFLKKIKFFRKTAYTQQLQYFKAFENEKVYAKTFPESVTFNFFPIASTQKDKPENHCSLYWGFFLYKYCKEVAFSCFFERKVKKNQNKKNCFLTNWNFNGMLYAQEVYINAGTSWKFWDKGKYWIPEIFLVSKKNGEKEKKNLGICKTFLAPSCKATALHAKKNTFEKSKQENHLVLKTMSLESIKKCVSFQEKNQKQNRVCIKYKKKSLILLNLYTQLLLKKLQNFKTKQNPPFYALRKNISLPVLWAIWGQKPLHLEISYKTGSFVYLYAPQKNLSPVCLNFKTL